MARSMSSIEAIGIELGKRSITSGELAIVVGSLEVAEIEIVRLYIKQLFRAWAVQGDVVACGYYVEAMWVLASEGRVSGGYRDSLVGEIISFNNILEQLDSAFRN